MKNLSYKLITFSLLLVGIFSLIFPTTFATNGNPFATDDTPYPHGVVPPPGGPVSDVNDALSILVSVIDLAQVVFWILTVGFGLYGAYLYLFATGNKESAAQARRVFIYTAIAALLAIIAYGLPGIIEGFVFGF